MDFASFKKTLSEKTPPKNSSVYLEALWYDEKGNWNKSHELIQDLPGTTAARIHAYLHRKEGDIWNADYWYQRAGIKRPAISLQEEWDLLVAELIQR